MRAAGISSRAWSRRRACADRACASELYGSLALTGLGTGPIVRFCSFKRRKTRHHRAGAQRADAQGHRASKELRLAGKHGIPFEESRDLLFERDKTLPAHPNGMKFYAFDATGAGMTPKHTIHWRGLYSGKVRTLRKRKELPALPFRARRNF